MIRPKEVEKRVSSQKRMHRELEQLHSDKKLARVGGDLRPWFARPVIWVGAIAAGGLVGVLFLIFLMASPV